MRNKESIDAVTGALNERQLIFPTLLRRRTPWLERTWFPKCFQSKRTAHAIRRIDRIRLLGQRSCPNRSPIGSNNRATTRRD